MHVVLVSPRIPTNTGNLIRLCANTGYDLHLVEPLGFSMDSALLKRGGLDYHEHACVRVHASLDAVAKELPGRWFAFTAAATRLYTDVEYQADDVLVFGCEPDGLSDADLARFDDDHQIRIPLRPNNRSLNLANAVAVTVFESWRQSGFAGSADSAGSLPTESFKSIDPS